MTSRMTVVGARGFIGAAVAARARAGGWDVVECRHDDVPGGNLGTIVYCSGVAWDAGNDPLRAYAVHVTAIAGILARSPHERAIYLSSTRVYDRAASTSEAAVTGVRSDAGGDVYALSKLAGEGAVLGAGASNRVVRLSNVYGASFRSGLFLSDILRQLAETGRIALRTSRESSKDYVSVDDVAECILRIAAGSEHAVYNVAAGRNTSHGALLDAILRAVPAEIAIASDAPTVTVPAIDVERVRRVFAFEPRNVLDDVPALVAAFVEALG
jgi:nucleoside-diphosphate-sugar epimerase